MALNERKDNITIAIVHNYFLMIGSVSGIIMLKRYYTLRYCYKLNIKVDFLIGGGKIRIDDNKNRYLKFTDMKLLDNK